MMQALEILQTYTYHDAKNGDELGAKMSSFSVLYEISANKANT